MQTKQVPATTQLAFPNGYLYMEDKIAQMSKLQSMMLERKHHGLSSYTIDKAAEDLLAALIKSCTAEVNALQQLLETGGIE